MGGLRATLNRLLRRGGPPAPPSPAAPITPLAVVQTIAATFLYSLVLKLFVDVTLKHQAPTAAAATAIWGGILLASFAGWGSGLNAALFPRVRADWGLRCAWGWGVAVVAGGLLCAASLATRRSLVGFVALGVGLFGVGLARDYTPQRGGSPARRLRVLAADAPFLAGAGAILGLAVVQAISAILITNFNPNDDNLAYFQFTREILDRGTLTQPFSLRRISAYGGKSVLDAMLLAVDVPFTHLHLLDRGLALVGVLGLIAGHRRSSPRSGRGLLLLAMLYVLCLPEIRLNSATLMTGVLFFLGLYRTLTFPPVARERGARAAVPVALLAAGACTLRQNYLVPVAALLIFAYAPPLLRGVRLRPLRVDPAPGRDAVVTAALVVAFLAPYAVLTARWCGTFLFPLSKGNYNPAYSFFPHLKPLEWAQYIWTNVCHGLPVKTAPLFLAAALAMRSRAARKPLPALVAAGFVGFAALLFGYSNGLPGDQARYYAGFTVAGVLAIALAAADLAARTPASRREKAERAVAVPLVVVALAIQIHEQHDPMFKAYKEALERLAVLQPAWPRSTPDPMYADLQRPVPEGAPLATMVEEPSRLDHQRNRVACLDMIGAVSPKPGIPLDRGGDALADYLVQQGYRYVIVVHPDKGKNLYNRETWRRQQKQSDKVWQDSAHFYLEAFDAFDELRATRVHLADVGNMTTLDLASRAPAPR